jgi:hypothetical protein
MARPRRRGPRRRPRRVHQPIHATLPPLVVAELDGRAAAAAPPHASRSAQITLCVRARAGLDYATARRLDGHAGVIRGAVESLRGRCRLPDDARLLGLLLDHAGRLAALARSLRAGDGPAQEKAAGDNTGR